MQRHSRTAMECADGKGWHLGEQQLGARMHEGRAGLHKLRDAWPVTLHVSLHAWTGSLEGPVHLYVHDPHLRRALRKPSTLLGT